MLKYLIWKQWVFLAATAFACGYFAYLLNVPVSVQTSIENNRGEAIKNGR
jgi:hypothetical protein